MDLHALQALVGDRPPAAPPDWRPYQAEVQDSVDYLASPKALSDTEKDPYWPKWDSPWWHILVLHQMGLSERVPQAAAQKLAEVNAASYIPGFFPEEMPPDFDPMKEPPYFCSQKHPPCFCSLGSLFQMLHGCGISLDTHIPWAREWIFRYTMADGGVNCDDRAYREPNPDGGPASSMVGTIVALEAILLCTSRELTEREGRFLDEGARGLIARKLMKGSHPEEREDEADWLAPCFPRLYFYDILRGLTFLTRWAEGRRRPLPLSAIADCVSSLASRFPDGRVRIGRRAYADCSNWVPVERGKRERRKETSRFPLLERVSRIGEFSPFLSAEWAGCLTRIDRLLADGLIGDA